MLIHRNQCINLCPEKCKLSLPICCKNMCPEELKGLNEIILAIYFRKSLQNTASKSNSKDMRKKAMAITFSWSNESICYGACQSHSCLMYIVKRSVMSRGHPQPLLLPCWTFDWTTVWCFGPSVTGKGQLVTRQCWSLSCECHVSDIGHISMASFGPFLVVHVR